MKLKGYLAGIILLITAFLFAWGCSSVSIIDSLVKEPEKETKEEAADTSEETVESETTNGPAASSTPFTIENKPVHASNMRWG